MLDKSLSTVIMRLSILRQGQGNLVGIRAGLLMEDSPGLFATIQIVPSRDLEDCLLVANVVKRKMRLELVNVDTPAVTTARHKGGKLIEGAVQFQHTLLEF